MKVICFDMDSTLVDSVLAHTKSYNKALKELGFKQKKKKVYFSLLGMPKEELVKKLIPKANKKVIEKITELHDNYLHKENYVYVKKLRYSLDALKYLKKRGYKIAITSNCNHKSIVVILKGAGISKRYFDLLIGNDEVKRSKPYPDEILKVAKKFKKKPEFVIGDSIYDVMAGKNAGAKTIAVLTGDYNKDQLKRYKPNFIIKNLKELKRIL